LQAEGLTAVEMWVVSCIIHVFGVLAEYAVILKLIQARHTGRPGHNLVGKSCRQTGIACLDIMQTDTSITGLKRHICMQNEYDVIYKPKTKEH
jgi:hypothetical protein